MKNKKNLGKKRKFNWGYIFIIFMITLIILFIFGLYYDVIKPRLKFNPEKDVCDMTCQERKDLGFSPYIETPLFDKNCFNNDNFIIPNKCLYFHKKPFCEKCVSTINNQYYWSLECEDKCICEEYEEKIVEKENESLSENCCNLGKIYNDNGSIFGYMCKYVEECEGILYNITEQGKCLSATEKKQFKEGDWLIFTKDYPPFEKGDIKQIIKDKVGKSPVLMVLQPNGFIRNVEDLGFEESVNFYYPNECEKGNPDYTIKEVFVEYEGTEEYPYIKIKTNCIDTPTASFDNPIHKCNACVKKQKPIKIDLEKEKCVEHTTSTVFNKDKYIGESIRCGYTIADAISDEEYDKYCCLKKESKPIKIDLKKEKCVEHTDSQDFKDNKEIDGVFHRTCNVLKVGCEETEGRISTEYCKVYYKYCCIKKEKKTQAELDMQHCVDKEEGWIEERECFEWQSGDPSLINPPCIDYTSICRKKTELELLRDKDCDYIFKEIINCNVDNGIILKGRCLLTHYHNLKTIWNEKGCEI